MAKRTYRPDPEQRATKRQRREPTLIKTEVTFGKDKIITTVTSSGLEVSDWLFKIRRMDCGFPEKLIVGLDVEWRPNYRRGQQNPVALLQLCVGRRCLIFQILHKDYIPDVLTEFLADPNYRFVGVGVQGDANLLSKDYGLKVANTVDLPGLAAEVMGKPELRQAGLKALVRAVMRANLEKPKKVMMGRWDAYNLSDEQIKYACIDAFVSYEIGWKLCRCNSNSSAPASTPSSPTRSAGSCVVATATPLISAGSCSSNKD